MVEHPIEGLMATAMSSIQDMVDVNTIIGEPIETSNNVIIVPISKVAFGFAAGGSEFKGETIDEYQKKEKEEAIQYRLPFGGGSGAGISINPVAFLIIQEDNVKLIPVSHDSAIDKLLDFIPDLMEKANTLVNKCVKNKEDCKEQNEKCVNEKNKDKNKEEKNGLKKKEFKKVKKEATKPKLKEKEIEYKYEFEDNEEFEDDEFEDYNEEFENDDEDFNNMTDEEIELDD